MCILPLLCGNGVKDPGEQCDGEDENGLHCTEGCRLQECGNGVTEPGEQCDDGNNADGDGCSQDCKYEFCRDGKVDNHEVCDPSVDAAHCNLDCTISMCSDGKWNAAAGEDCDEGTDSTTGQNNNHAGARCNASCKFNVCGDGDVLSGVEQCDPGKDALGNVQDTAACDHDCTIPVCGDRLVNTQAGEDCDDGPDNGKLGHCDSGCKFVHCGNGVVDIGEDCDDGEGGVARNSARCNWNCTFAQCGDGFLNDQFKPDGLNPEVCDNVDPTTHASLNGVPCDYGDPNCTRCNATCTGSVGPGGPFCGDGIWQKAFEQCDPATGPGPSSPLLVARADSETCNFDCTLPTCGDRHVNTAAHEGCDDGNNDDCGTCAAGCMGSPIPATQATITIRTTSGDQIGIGDQDDSFTLDDGFGKLLTFEFTTGSTTIPGAVPIPFVKSPTADGAATIASHMAAAIHSQAQGGFGIDASVPSPGDPTTVILTNKRSSSRGNTTIKFTGLIGFVFGTGTPQLAGGLAGDCAAATGCATGDDCASGTCNITTHKCT